MFKRLAMYYLVAAILLTQTFIFLATPAAYADEMYQMGTSRNAPSADSMICDVVIVRPLGVVTITVGTAFFIVSLPFGLVSGSTATAEKALVADPFHYTFTRPLGEFERY